MMRHRALNPVRTFGRRAVPAGTAVATPQEGIQDDLKLFAMTFMGGFLFMTIYLA